MYKPTERIELSGECAADRERILSDAENGLRKMNFFISNTHSRSNYSKKVRPALEIGCYDAITGGD